MCVVQATSFDLVPCVFFPFFSILFLPHDTVMIHELKKQRPPSECAKRPIAETSTLETPLFWYIDTQMGCMLHIPSPHRLTSRSFFHAGNLCDLDVRRCTYHFLHNGMVEFTHSFHPSTLLHSHWDFKVS